MDEAMCLPPVYEKHHRSDEIDDRHVWWQVDGVDGLSSAMARGEALHGFQEAPVAFPPSFRWYARWATAYLMRFPSYLSKPV